MTGIYKITNKINGKSYIGQSINVENRLRQHKKKIGSHENPMYIDFQKYGLENFSFEILEDCSCKYLNDREIYWIQYYDSFNTGYNLTPGGRGKYGHEKYPTKSIVHNEIKELINIPIGDLI